MASQFLIFLPTDILLTIKVAGMTFEVWTIQEKQNGEFVTDNNSNNVLSNFGSIANTIAGVDMNKDVRIWYASSPTLPATSGFANTLTYKGFL